MIKPWSLVCATSLVLVSASALADTPAGAKPDAPAKAAPAPAEHDAAPPAKSAPGNARAPRAPKLPPLPVKLTIDAPTQDPPWRIRIENTGEERIRIPADIRLLSLELVGKGAKKSYKKKCAAPAAMRPSRFPKARELYLEPGDAWEEVFDPRLLCFGDATDALRDGVTVTPRFGFGPGAGGAGSFAAQGTDRPAAYASLAELVADALQPATPGATPPSPADPAAASPSSSGAAASPAGKTQPAALTEGPATDRNAPELDVYVSRFAEATNPRELVVTIRAVNEGGRALATVVRSRMLAFRVEELAADNTARATTECRGQDHPHAIPIEAVANVRPGREVSLPILLAEVCPRATFARPGLYRVLPELDTTVSGELTKVDPHMAQALARQSSLVRIATSQQPFYTEPPMSERGKHEAEARAKAAKAEAWARAERERRSPQKGSQKATASDDGTPRPTR
jgi:hypothetical protein